MYFLGIGETPIINKNYVGLIITAKNTTQTVAVAKTIAGWTAIFEPATPGAMAGMYIPLEGGYEDKTEAPQMTKSNNGFFWKTDEFAPAIDGYPMMTEDDYATFKSWDATTINVAFMRSDGKIVHCLSTAGLQKGFAAKIFVDSPVTKPQGADSIKEYPFHIMLTDFNEWNQKVETQPSFSIEELKAVSPIGYNIEIYTPYEASGKTVVIKATKRGSKTAANPAGDPVSILTTTSEWEITSHGDTGGAITVVGATLAGAGLYTLTVVNSAAAMTAPFYIRGFKVTTSHVTHITNILKCVTP